MWEGLTRVATSLSILHAEGSIHRTLSSESIFTDDRGDFDFRISGFEWSLQISSSSSVSAKLTGVDRSRLKAPELIEQDGRYSFATDWFDFGLLAAEILGLDIPARGPRALQKLREDIISHRNTSVRERALLHDLLEVDPYRRLAQGPTVLQNLADVSASVRSRNISRGKSLYVGFHLGVGSFLSEAIFDCTRDKKPVQTADLAAQIAFIERDLADSPRVIARDQPHHYVLVGRRLDYRVNKWNVRSETTWDAGFCGGIEGPRSDPTDKNVPLENLAIAVRTTRQIADNFKRIRSDGVSWDVAFPLEKTIQPLTERQRLVLEFFKLTNQLDALLAAAQLWPVVVVSTRSVQDKIILGVSPIKENDRDVLAQNLGLPQTDQQMKDFFAEDQTVRLSEDSEFSFARVGMLVRRDEQANTGGWRFRDFAEHPAGIRYYFDQDDIGHSLLAVDEILYLTPRDLAGTVKQLHRRHQAIDAMRNHAILLDTISDPLRTRRDTDVGHSMATFKAGLDDSKQRALEGILCTQPLFALQGPPGTGKTRLLASLASGLLAADPTAQILLTAHSHEAVRNARRAFPKDVKAGTELADRPIIIRLDDEEDEDHVRKWAVTYSSGLANSQLAAGSPNYLLERARSLADPTSGTSLEFKSFEALIRQAANLVFATSNSGELARMLEDDRRFDWSIIEEAGKAHGFDLALALQASHRLLLIGDQDQLPPHNFERFEGLFREPPRILNALRAGAQFAPGLMDRSTINTDAGEQQRFADNCVEWLQMVHFFADIFERASKSIVNNVAIAQSLIYQHRMHQDIARLVSHCFYAKKLETHPDAQKFFSEAEVPYQYIENTWMPTRRIIFVDMPWIQNVKNAVSGESGSSSPRYSNALEVEVVGRVLSQIQARPTVTCHVQILSPYRAQVRQLISFVSDQITIGGKLQNLLAPEFGMEGKRRGATVDEFQGSEADIVVVSLVRNNDERRGKGLGFLADARRMNVLMSRARHKLIIVGSWDFLESRTDCNVEPRDEEELAHIARLVRFLKSAFDTGTASRVPFSATAWARLS